MGGRPGAAVDRCRLTDSPPPPGAHGSPPSVAPAPAAAQRRESSAAHARSGWQLTVIWPPPPSALSPPPEPLSPWLDAADATPVVHGISGDASVPFGRKCCGVGSHFGATEYKMDSAGRVGNNWKDVTSAPGSKEHGHRGLPTQGRTQYFLRGGGRKFPCRMASRVRKINFT